MKNILLLTLPTLFVYKTQAQEVIQPLPKTYNKEIGVFGQQLISSGDEENISMGGIQFKAWKNTHFGIRAITAYGSYYDYSNFFMNRNQIISPDTIVEKYTTRDINMGIVGFGLEAQRKFYKRVTLFAAVEVRGGYGTGTQDEHTVTRYQTSNEYYENRTPTDTKKTDMIYVALAPTIGAKIQFKRINFGMEMTGINMNYKGIKVENVSYGRYGASDLNVGDLTHRIFFSYGF